jgi:hypothetical protein
VNFAGTVFSAAERVAAKADVTRVLGTAAGHARAAGDEVIQANARAPFTLVEHEPAVAEAFMQRFHDSVIWRHDTNCFNRAMTGAHLLDEMSGLGAGPADDVFAGAIHVEQEVVDGGLTGRFHGSLALRIQGHEKPAVLDFLNGRPFVHFDDETLPPVTQLIRPYAGTGVPGRSAPRTNWVGPYFFDHAARTLTEAWDGAETRVARPAALVDTVAAVRRGMDPKVSATELQSSMMVRANDVISFD